jgi:hypothetical protein
MLVLQQSDISHVGAGIVQRRKGKRRAAKQPRHEIDRLDIPRRPADAAHDLRHAQRHGVGWRRDPRVGAATVGGQLFFSPCTGESKGMVL